MFNFIELPSLGILVEFWTSLNNQNIAVFVVEEAADMEDGEEQLNFCLEQILSLKKGLTKVQL